MEFARQMPRAGLALCCLLALVQGAGAEEPAVKTYKQNFFLHARDFNIITDSRESEEAELQLSMKYRPFSGQHFYFGYTQKSFWQIYDQDRSRPFRENNFNPEFFYDQSFGVPEFALQIGGEHESNGRGFEIDESGASINKSRSWNRIYVQPKFKFSGQLLTTLKLWYRIEEDAKLDVADPGGDDNPDIQQYLGYLEWRIAWIFGGNEKFQLLSMIRDGRKSGTGTLQLDFLYKPDSFSPGIYIQFHLFKGYGESLIDYNREVEKVGIGFAAGNPFATSFPR